MKLSVVIVNFKVREHLEQCVESVAEADEVIVVDNGSDDGSTDWIAQRFPEAILVALPQNLGFGAAVNRGVAKASGDSLLLLNPDASLGPGHVPLLKDCLSENPAVDAFGFRQVDEFGHFQLAHGGDVRFLDEFLRLLTQKSIDRGWHWVGRGVDAVFSEPQPVSWVAASCLLVRREAFARVHGFDEGFFLYFEDIDFCIRLRQAGSTVVYDPTLTVLHHRGQSASKVPRQASVWYRQSQLRFWRKHRGERVASAVFIYQALRRALSRK